MSRSGKLLPAALAQFVVTGGGPTGPMAFISSEEAAVTEDVAISVGVTVPANCNFAVLAIAEYDSETNDVFFETAAGEVTLGGSSMTKGVHVSGDDASDVLSLAFYYLINPPTGARTLVADLDTAAPVFAGAVYQMIYFSGVDTSDPIADTDAAPNSGVTGGATPLSLTPSSSDDITLHLIGAATGAPNASHTTTTIRQEVIANESTNDIGFHANYAANASAPGYTPSAIIYESHIAMSIRSL